MNGDHRLGRPPAKPWRSVLGRKVFPPGQGVGPSANLLFETDNHPFPDGTYGNAASVPPARRTTTLAPVPPWAERRDLKTRP